MATYEWLPVSTTIAMPCVVQADSNIPLAGLIEVDGVDLQVNDRVLVRGQTNPVQNGIYVAQAGAWTRAGDFANVRRGTRVYVTDGRSPDEYAITTANPVVGTTPIEFISVQAAIFAGLLPDLGEAGPGAVLRATGPETPAEWHMLTKADLGLGEVDNTNDMAKPVSTATEAALALLRTQVPLLDSNGKVPVSAIPAYAIVDIFTVASQAAQLAIVGAEKGDVAIRSDENRSYVHNGGTAGTMADWTWLRTPTDAVFSVAGKVGAITLDRADVGLSNAAETNVVNQFTVEQRIAAANTSAQLRLERTGPSPGQSWLGTDENDLFAVRPGDLSAPRLQLSRSGALKVPNNPVFTAFASGEQASSGFVIFTNHLLQRGATYNVSNGRFIAPQPGVYWFSTTLFINKHASASQYGYAQFYRNGVAQSPLVHSSINTPESYHSISLSHAIAMSADDYVQVFAGLGNGATIYAGSYNSFAGFFLG